MKQDDRTKALSRSKNNVMFLIPVVDIEMSNSNVLLNVAVAIDEYEYEYEGFPRDEHHDIVLDEFLQLQELIAIVERMIQASERSTKDNARQWIAFSTSRVIVKSTVQQTVPHLLWNQ